MIVTAVNDSEDFLGKVCKVPGCDRKYLCRDLCSSHYARLKRLGDVQADRPVRVFDMSDTPLVEKKRARGREWYERNSTKKISDNRSRQIVKYEWVAEIKLSSGCVDCPTGTVWPAECLDFDHVRGEKLFDVAACMSRTRDVILAEIAKCEVVCANHHRIRTQQRRGESD